MRATLILNPTSGASMLAAHPNLSEENKEAILVALHARGIEPDVCYTTPDLHGDEIAKQAAAQGAELVIAAGGDGTLHAVASGLVGTNSTLGIIPIGTMNNIARSLHIPEDIEQACDVIASDFTCLIDVGKLNDHIFLEVAGVGLEAALFPAAEEFKSHGWFSTLQGIIKALFTLFTFKSTRFRIAFDNHKTHSFKAVQVSICNSPYYGARLQFAPNALMDDGFLDVLIYKNLSKFEFMRHAFSISQGKRDVEPRIKHHRVKTISIATDQPMEVHADGDPQGFTPVTISIVASILRVRVPKDIASGPNMANASMQQAQGTKRSKHASGGKIVIMSNQVSHE